MVVAIKHPSSGIRFKQDAKPVNQAQDGVLWLRTTDFNLFSWDNANTRWLSVSAMHMDFTGPDTFTGITANSEHFVYIHENQTDATGKSFRTRHSYVIQQLAINAMNTPASDDGLRVRNGGASQTLLNWDGVIKYAVTDGLDIEIAGEDISDPPNRMNLRWVIGTTAPASTQRMRGTLWYRWRVPGD